MRYKMNIEMKYGCMNINLGSTYKEALEKYNKVIQHSDSVVLLKPYIDNRFSNNSPLSVKK